MPTPNAARLMPRLALDVALWYSVPLAFIAAYVAVFSQPATAILPHLLVVALPLAAIILMRIALSWLLPGAALNRLAASALTSLAVTLLLSYYALVVIGLMAWGGVVSREVIPTFLRQADVLADLLHVPTALVAWLPALFFGGFTPACWWYLKRFDWTVEWTGRAPAWMVCVVMLAGFGAVAICVFDFSFGAGTSLAEPFSLTLFSQRGSLALEGYTANPIVASRVDRSIDLARRAYQPSATPGRKNLVLIVVDALRPDHMGVYGYPRQTTPNLARLSTQLPTRIISGTHASCGDTACAMFSLFSSKFPSEFSFHPFFLHEALRRNSYRIHLLLSGDQTYFYGLRKFYGAVDTFYDGNQVDSAFLNDDHKVVEKLASMADWDGRPVMLQFHLMSAHVLRRRQAVPGPFMPAERYGLELGRDIGPGGRPPPAAVNYYDDGVYNADDVIASLLGLLDSKGYLHDTLVVITADHGEMLGEHGLFKHANGVREQLLRIPLLFFYYGFQPTLPVRARPYPSQVDIAPTILAELGLPIPASWVGWPLQRPDSPDFSFFAEHAFAGLIDHRDPAHVWKYWVDGKSGEDHVFELVSDPDENHDLRDLAPREPLAVWRARVRADTAAALAVR